MTTRTTTARARLSLFGTGLICLALSGCSSLVIRKDANGITIAKNDVLVIKNTTISGHYQNGAETLDLTAESKTDPSPGAMVLNSLISAAAGYVAGGGGKP